MIHILSSVLWSITTTMIIVSGLKFTKKLNYVQFKLSQIFKSLHASNIKVLFLTLAGRIGVGSIAGVALAIYLGGPGTIFWMWILVFVSAPLTYSETVLAVKYKEKKTGGPSQYIKKGINNNNLAVVYSVIVIISYLLGFIPIQANTIVKSFDSITQINHIIIGISLAILTFTIIKGGIKKITKVTNYLVPIMGLIYIIITIIIIINHIDKLPNIIKEIVYSAFNFKSFISGFIPTLLIGIQRGIFSNESGLGLGAIAASSSSNKNASQIGYIQILGVYLTTCIICTATAFIILLSDYHDLIISNPNGIEFTTKAFEYHFGNKGSFILFICILLFSFSTVLTGHYYCESSLKTLKAKTKIIPLLTPLSIMFGSLNSSSLIWSSVDILVAILGIINIYAINKLNKEIVSYHKKYGRI